MPPLYGLLRLTLLLRAMIKTASSEGLIATENLCSECKSYRLPGVCLVKCLRQMYDKINNCTLAFKWLDTTLGETKDQLNARTYALIKSCLGAALASCVILDGQRHVNTGTASSVQEV